MLTNLSKEQQLIILGLVVVIVSGLGVMAYRRFIPSESGDMFVSEPQANLPIVKTPEIVVHVTGAVKKEGVYKLKPGDRIVDVLELAGGAEMRADFSSINLAEKVKDGQKIVIPVKPGDLGYLQVKLILTRRARKSFVRSEELAQPLPKE